MTDLRKLLIEARPAVAAGCLNTIASGDKKLNAYMTDLLARIDAALAEKVEPVAEVHVIFDGPPSHESGRFVECENADGKSINAGRWEQRGRYWHLIINAAPADQWRRVEDGLPPNWKIKVTGPDSDGLLWLTISNTSGRHLSFSAASGDGLLRGAILTELMRDLSALPEADK